MGRFRLSRGTRNATTEVARTHKAFPIPHQLPCAFLYRVAFHLITLTCLLLPSPGTAPLDPGSPNRHSPCQVWRCPVFILRISRTSDRTPAIPFFTCCRLAKTHPENPSTIFRKSNKHLQHRFGHSNLAASQYLTETQLLLFARPAANRQSRVRLLP